MCIGASVGSDEIEKSYSYVDDSASSDWKTTVRLKLENFFHNTKLVSYKTSQLYLWFCTLIYDSVKVRFSDVLPYG